MRLFNGSRHSLVLWLRQAEPWYPVAAAQGDPDAMFNLAELYMRDGDMETAVAWYLKAAEMGHYGALPCQGDGKAGAIAGEGLDRFKMI